jgi:hypothetical protein
LMQSAAATTGEIRRPVVGSSTCTGSEAGASWSAANPSSPFCDGALSRQGARKCARWLYEPV